MNGDAHPPTPEQVLAVVQGWDPDARLEQRGPMTVLVTSLVHPDRVLAIMPADLGVELDLWRPWTADDGERVGDLQIHGELTFEDVQRECHITVQDVDGGSFL